MLSVVVLFSGLACLGAGISVSTISPLGFLMILLGAFTTAVGIKTAIDDGPGKHLSKRDESRNEETPKVG